jgi:hypothetical protein
MSKKAAMAVILGIIVVASAVTAYFLNVLPPKSVPQQEEHNQGEDNSTIIITTTTARVQGAAEQNFETEAERKILGINKSTLWYQEKKMAEVYINDLGGEGNRVTYHSRYHYTC